MAFTASFVQEGIPQSLGTKLYLFQIDLRAFWLKRFSFIGLMSLKKIGGAGRNRTDDLYNAIVALSQLSYGPHM